MVRQVFSQLQESRAAAMWWWLGKTNTSPNIHAFLLPPALCAEHDTMWCGISLESVGLSYPSCVPSRLLVHPRPPWCDDVRSKKDPVTMFPHGSFFKRLLYYFLSAEHLNLWGIEILVSVVCIRPSISVLLKLSSGILCLGQSVAEWLKPVVATRDI